MRYLGRFRHTGSLCPSSKNLANAMFGVASTYVDAHDEIVFAGIGSGVIARLFAKLSKRVVFVDIDREFCQRFEHWIGPHQEVVCADLQNYLLDAPPGPRRLIVSCLPMRGAFRSDQLRDILLDQVARGDTIVFFSYLPRASWARKGGKVRAADGRVTRQASIFRNIPPAFVYSLSSPGRDGMRHEATP